MAKNDIYTELAEKLGIAFQNLSVWEHGKTSPSAKYLLKLSEVLEISLDQLTSPNAFIGYPDPSSQRPGHPGFQPATDPVDPRSQELINKIQEELPQLVRSELSKNPTIKLIITNVEEILSLLRPRSGS